MWRARTLVLLATLGCGARTGLGTEHDASIGANDGGVVDLCADAASPIDAGVPEAGGCVANTSISGTVFDPRGTEPLFNVLVYVPSTPLEPIADGVQCAACGAAASGHPVALTATDAHGHFRLSGVPAGANVPLVMQLGKWRREVTVDVAPCVDNPITDADRTRLPRDRTEGSIPRIALTTGACDDLGCFLERRIGLASTELTAPGQGGRVEIYTGEGAKGPDPSFHANTLFDDRERLMSYDIVLAACECWVRPRSAAAYANVQYYLDHGGRFFGGHYHYNFFASAAQCASGFGACGGSSDFASVASWAGPHGSIVEPQSIDVSHPRGAALAQRLADDGLATGTSIQLRSLRSDVGETSSATRWVYGSVGASYDTYYLTFNTPVGSATPCGRAVFSDIHSTETYGSGGNGSGTCGDLTNEAVLEFLFFDLASCVQDDRAPPTTPCSR